MLNVQKLKGKMLEKGLNVKTLPADLGLSPATFYRKMKNNSFEIREADKIVDILSLSGKEAKDIFFSSNVA